MGASGGLNSPLWGVGFWDRGVLGLGIAFAVLGPVWVFWGLTGALGGLKIPLKRGVLFSTLWEPILISLTFPQERGLKGGENLSQNFLFWAPEFSKTRGNWGLTTTILAGV